MVGIQNDQWIIIPAVCSLLKHWNLLFHCCYLESQRSQTSVHCQSVLAFKIFLFVIPFRRPEDMVLLRRKAPYNLQYNLQLILWHITGNTCVIFTSNIAQYRIQRIKSHWDSMWMHQSLLDKGLNLPYFAASFFLHSQLPSNLACWTTVFCLWYRTYHIKEGKNLKFHA
jgi:hypothetical protein